MQYIFRICLMFQTICSQNYLTIANFREITNICKDAFCKTDGEAVRERKEGAAHIKEVCKEQGFFTTNLKKNTMDLFVVLKRKMML